MKVILLLIVLILNFFRNGQTGTPRYLINICSWLAAIEKHEIKKDWLEGTFNSRLKYFDIKIDYNVKFNRFMQKKIYFKIWKLYSLLMILDIYFDKVMQLFCGNFFEERRDNFYIWNQDNKKLS